MEQRFTLSKSNKIYYGIVAVAFIVLFIVAGDISSATIGRLTGKLIGFLLFPAFFAWIVWRLSGKNEREKSLTFHIVLTLTLLGQVGQAMQRVQQQQKLDELAVYKKEFKETVSKDPETFNSAHAKFVDSYKKKLDSLSKTGTDSERQLFKIIHEFISKTQTMNQDWNNSIAAVQSPEILDYTLLNSDKVFENQIKVIQLYLDKTKAHQVFYKNFIPDLKERLSVLGENSVPARDTLEGATNKYLSQKPIMEPLIQAHLEYGNGLLRALEFLKKHQGEWVYTQNELNFSKDDMTNQYSKLLEDISKSEATINALSQKFLEKM